jgi:hypothetical protein
MSNSFWHNTLSILILVYAMFWIFFKIFSSYVILKLKSCEVIEVKVRTQFSFMSKHS